jgi:NodT family efflux transporter outer membrane factor (OMF) lipoprotein
MVVPPNARTPRPRASCVVAALATLLVAGCAAGSDFKKPAAPHVDRYTATPMATATVSSGKMAAGSAQHFDVGRDVAGDWWTLFHSQPLNALIDAALKHSPDLKAAQAALKVAHEDVLAQRGTFLPSVSAGIDANRQEASNILAPVPNFPAVPEEFMYNLFTPQVSVSYTPDVFGLNRRSVESLKAQEQAVRFQMIAVYNTLTANVVVTAIQIASLQAQIDATRKLVDLNRHMLTILHYQLTGGAVSQQDVAAQQALLAQAESALPGLVKQLTQQRNRMAVLAGRFPSQGVDADFTLASLHLPEQLPVSLPSKLVAQRPDIRQAQANLHAASAQIGVAAANRLPQIQLSADAGSTALAISKVFSPGTGFWNLTTSITAPIFEGGTLMHQERAAKANYTQAAAQYRSTVLSAFEDVADTLTALEQDAKGLQAAATAADAAKTSLDIAQRQVKDGYAAPLSLLNAEQAWQQAQISLVQAQANRYADSAALFQALGGGWWHRKDSTRDTHEK